MEPHGILLVHWLTWNSGEGLPISWSPLRHIKINFDLETIKIPHGNSCFPQLLTMSHVACLNFKYDKAIKSNAETSDGSQDCEDK